MSKCYAVASGKGGVGKSVLTANIAASLAQRGLRTLIIDADIGLRSQDTLLSLENNVVYDLVDLTDEKCTAEQAILTCDSIPSLHLLPAAQFERAKSLSPKKFAHVISSMRNTYNYIFIDCPAGIERGLRNVLNAGIDEAILIVTSDDISIRSAERACQVIESKCSIRPLLIVNRLDKRLVKNGEMMSAAAVSQVLDLQLLGVIPEDPAVFRTMLNHRLFVQFECEARNAVFRISSRILGQAVHVQESGKGKTTFSPFLRFRQLKEVKPIDDF